MIKLSEDNEGITILKQESVRDTFPLHTHDFYEFFLVIKGRAIHVVNNVSHIVERGSLVLVRPSDFHCYDYYKSTDFEFYNKGFPIELFCNVNKVYDNNADVLVNSPLPKHVKLNEKLMHVLEEQLLSHMEIPSAKDRAIPLSMLVSFVIFLMLTVEDFSTNKMLPDWLLFALDEMSKPVNFIAGLPRLLELCNYTQAHINREFKRFLDTTPTKFINELRLRYAHKLLVQTNSEIIDIVQDSGFNNLSHFYTEFKNYYGYTPNKTRKTY